MTATTLTGGCQCGAVRYAITGALSEPSICHCRMCQKAFGGAFAPLVGVRLADLAWTRGRPRLFDSSNEVARGFCVNCGTPLTFAYNGAELIDVAIATLDDPAVAEPTAQVWAESRLGWTSRLNALPARGRDDEGYDEIVAAIAASNHQHPDRETPNTGAQAWTPRPAREWSER